MLVRRVDREGCCYIADCGWETFAISFLDDRNRDSMSFVVARGWCGQLGWTGLPASSRFEILRARIWKHNLPRSPYDPAFV